MLVSDNGIPNVFFHNYTFLPDLAFLLPASEGWGKVIFSLCVSVHTSTGGGGVPHFRSGWGKVIFSLVCQSTPRLGGGGYPISGLDWGGGVPHPMSGRGGGYPPDQDWMG